MRLKLQIGSLQADSVGTGSAAATGRVRQATPDRYALVVMTVGEARS